MPALYKNIADHRWLAQDNLSDCADNIAYWLGQAGAVVSGNTTITASAVGSTPLTVQGASSSQTASPVQVKQNSGGNTLFEVGTVSGAATGVKITPAAAASGVAVAATSTGTDETIKIDGKGAGIVKLATISTGGVQIGKIADATNIALGSTTGTKIGTATTQKLGFYNATPIVQGSVTGALSTVADAPAKAVLTSIIAELVALGLVADGTS